MLSPSSLASPIPSTSFAAHAETLSLQASVEALSDHFKSPVIVDGLPGSPIRPAEKGLLDTPDDLIHLIFYPSDKTDQMSLMIHVAQNGQQMLIFEVTLPVDDNLLFRGAAPAALAV